MDRNIRKLLSTTIFLYNRKVTCNPRSNANIMPLLVRNNSNKLKAAFEDATLRNIKLPVKPKRPPGAGWLLVTVPVATFCLGVWQVRRREWKLELIANLKAKTEQPPVDLPDDLSKLEDMTYRRVKLKGRFDHSQEMYLGPRSILQKGSSESGGGIFTNSGDVRARTGYLVVTPFILSGSGERILVNRGWVNTKLVSPEKRLEGQIEEEVEFTGIVRDNEERDMFVGANILDIRIFHYRDLKTMALMGKTLPVYVDACEDCTVQGGPIGGQTNLSIRNEHMSYIITWFSLSGITFFMWLRMVLR